MTLQDLGSVGELIAAVATVITLAYLAVQIRHFSTASRADAARSSAELDTGSLAIAQDPELAGILMSGLASFSSLEPVQRMRFSYAFGTMVGACARYYENVSLGIVSEAHFKNRSQGHLLLLETPGGSEFWHAFAHSYPPEFREYVRREIKVRPQEDSTAAPLAAQQAVEPDVE